jgi:hypothetical protein
VQQLAAHGDARADAGAQDRREHHLGPRAGPIGGLAQRQAVGIVLEPDRTRQQRLQILAQRLADEHGRIGVAHPPGHWRQAAGYAHAQRQAGGAQVCFGPRHQTGDRAQRSGVIPLRRGAALAQQQRALRVHGGDPDLGAAQVDAQPQSARGHGAPASNARMPSSSITGTPSSRALSSLLPASSPATT